MSLTCRKTHELHSKVKETLTNPTTQRGLGVHNEIRGVLYYLRHEHNFSREQLWAVLNARDGYARNPAVPHHELDSLVEGLFTSGRKPASKGHTAIEAAARIATENCSTFTSTATQHASYFEGASFQIKAKRKPLKPTPLQIAAWQANAERAVVDFKFTEKHATHQPLPTSNERKGCAQFLDALYQLFNDDENVSIVTASNTEGKPIANDRAKTCSEWVKVCNAYSKYPYEGMETRRGGVWWRVNPMNAKGSGKYGAMTDTDVAIFRHLLVENDVLPLALQLKLIETLMSEGRLSPLSIVDSGGKSYHALVKCETQTAGEYKDLADDILYPLHEEFGFDLGNSNPSRMSRAAGFTRIIGRRDDGVGAQSLIYLAERRTA